ncbi:DedA family protein [Microbacterium sp. bgisy207]|uniref:DedA family protein n=1 Tax=Microbacterium sp. bgisy207 TaxID=3413800 RepID=UPI003EB9E208
MGVIDEVLTQVASSVWALPLMFALVLADSLLVIVPGEVAVTAFGALAVTVGSPPLAGVVLLAALAAFLGDMIVYIIGRRVGLERWAWMRGRRVSAAIGWAHRRLHRSSATVVFTARFIPFARLAVNLTAGAARLPAPRYLALVAAAATGWAIYQAAVGAIVGRLVPGGPVVAVLISIAVAIVLGVAIDLVVARVSASRGTTPPASADSSD